MITAWERFRARRATAAAQVVQRHVAAGDPWNALQRVALNLALEVERA